MGIYSTPIGLRFVRAALRDADGTIKIPVGQVIASGYNGLQAYKSIALTVTLPEPNKVTAHGDDRPYQTFMLPPEEGVTGELRTTVFDADLVAMLTDTTQWGVSPIRKVGIATDMQGSEPAMLMWGSSEAKDRDPVTGLVYNAWLTYILLSAICVPMLPTKERAAIGEMRYSVAANDSGTDEVGKTFSDAINGFTNAPLIAVMTRGRFGFCAWKQASATTVFNLPAGEFPLYGGSTPQIYVNAVKQTSDYVVDADLGTVTFTPAPADAAKIVALYEY